VLQLLVADLVAGVLLEQDSLLNLQLKMMGKADLSRINKFRTGLVRCFIAAVAARSESLRFRSM